MLYLFVLTHILFAKTVLTFREYALVVLYQHLHPPAARTYGKCWNHKNH